MTKVQQFLADIGERMITTFIQAFLSTLLVTSNVSSLGEHTSAEWVNAAYVGLFAAAVCFLTTLVNWMAQLKNLTNPMLDLVYRTVLTFGQTLLGYTVTAGAVSALAFDWDTALLASATAAATALLKAMIGLNSPTLGASVFVPGEHLKAA